MRALIILLLFVLITLVAYSEGNVGSFKGRRYLLFTPSKEYNGKLLILLHGGLGNARSMAKRTMLVKWGMCGTLVGAVE